MRKYWQVYKISVQNTLAYRGAVFIYRITGFLWLLVIASAWLTSTSPGLIGGYSINELMTYYLVSTFIVSIVLWYPVETIKREITQGLLPLQILLKPVSYFRYKFFQELGWHTVSPLFSLINLSLSLALFGQYFVWGLSLPQLSLFILALGLAAGVMFSLSFCVGLLSFWFTETDGISSVIWMGLFIFGGQGIPISFFSKTLIQLVNLLPFRYIFSFPLEIFTHRLDMSGILVGFGLQISWLVTFWIIGKILWRRGLRVYSSYGN